ncbi:MAG: hypothetical protein LBR64_00035 [Dysgonamonadaceae bacterium]|nr:hypothetical protein [Dysgonamonadaceae bacterium]
MEKLKDVALEKNSKGAPTYIKFNFNKYGALLYPFCVEQGLEFPGENIPNETTIKALEEAHNNKDLKTYTDMDEFLKDLFD